MDLEADTQSITVPRQGDYIYLSAVESSDAHYIRRVYQLNYTDPSGAFVVMDHLGYEQHLERIPFRNMGHAQAWKVVGI